MPKPKPSFYDRAMEALRERYPRDATQRHLAALAGVKQPTVNDWKTGEPAIATGVRLANALGVCVEWIYTERGPKHPPAKPSSDSWADLNEEQRRELERFADFIRAPPPR